MRVCRNWLVCIIGIGVNMAFVSGLLNLLDIGVGIEMEFSLRVRGRNWPMSFNWIETDVFLV